MKITRDWLDKNNACPDGVAWFSAQSKTDSTEILHALLADENGDALSWANWLIVRVMKQKDCIANAIFAARAVLDIYERNFPTDTRPRLAIEAAEAVLC